jgi:hypothetical protein
MAHRKALRVIGQSLEVAKVPAFELASDGPSYIVKSDSLTQTGEWILRHALRPNDFSEQTARQSTVNRSVRFSPADISRLDDQAQKQRRQNSSLLEMYGRLSQLLRTLGDHLDRTNVRAFHISWTPESVFVDFQLLDGQCDNRTFTPEKLLQLGSPSRFRRSGRTGLDSSLLSSPKETKPRNR